MRFVYGVEDMENDYNNARDAGLSEAQMCLNVDERAVRLGEDLTNAIRRGNRIFVGEINEIALRANDLREFRVYLMDRILKEHT